MSDKRCKHLNGVLLEYSNIFHQRIVKEGIVAENGYNDIGNIIGYYFECDDCGKTIDYKDQKWLKKYKDKL